MAEFANMLGSDEEMDDNEDIDHIPKTPGPVQVSDREESDDENSDEDKDEEKDDRDVDELKSKADHSDSDSVSSDSESQSSNDNNRNSRNDSEVERSDNENDNKVENEANDEQSSDDNNDKSDIEEEKAVNESQDNESDDEEVVRHVSNNKRKFNTRDSSSDESNDSKSNKKKRIESSDNEDNDNDDNEKEGNDNDDNDNEDNVTKTAKAKDIFGDMSSEDEDEDNERQKDSAIDGDKRSEKGSSDDENDDRVNNREGFGEQSFVEEEEAPEEPVPEIRIEVEIPRIVGDLGDEIHFVKLPNFLSIDTHPYDPQWYEDEIDEDEIQDDEGRARLKLKVENTIRWRNVYDKESGEVKKESNARAVRWSDGSLSLHLGDEIFDLHKLQLMAGDNNHLFIRQGTGLQGQAVFTTKLTFRPFSTESFTHRKLTLSLADRSQKTQKIRVLPNVGKDPEAHRSEMIKKEEDRLKASIRRENKQKRVRERSLIRGPTASYLEPDADEDDEEEGISISRIKNQYKKGGTGFIKYPDEPDSGEDSKPAIDDDDSDDMFEKKSDVKKKAKISDDEED